MCLLVYLMIRIRRVWRRSLENSVSAWGAFGFLNGFVIGIVIGEHLGHLRPHPTDGLVGAFIGMIVGVFVRLLFGPAAVEIQSNRRMNPWKIFPALGVLLLLIPLMVVSASCGYLRHQTLAQVPDVGAPFDVMTVALISVADDQNAFTIYREATAMLVDLRVLLKDDDKRIDVAVKNKEAAIRTGWPIANRDVRDWLSANREALGVWKRGTDCPDAMDVSPAALAWDTPLPVTQEARNFVSLALLEASRSLAEGRSADAWIWYRACLRSSRHFCMHACGADRATGAALYALTTEPILQWCARSETTANDLRTALAETVMIDGLTPPLSDCLKIDYLGNRNKEQWIPYPQPPAGGLVPLWDKLTGGRERVRRIENLLFANWLSQADRPRFLRTSVDVKTGMFELDAKTKRDARLLPPEAVAKRSDLVHLFLIFRTYSQSLFDSCDRDAARRSALMLSLAVQLHYREHGQLPLSLDQLVKVGYLKSIPADPFGKGEPFHYRRETNPRRGALLWSIWMDGIDQGGKIDVGLHDGEASPGDKIFRTDVPRKATR